MSEYPSWTMQTVATVSSPYKQKFAIPRQPGLVKHAYGTINMLPEFSHPDFLRGLQEFSHLWIQFVFHETADKGWSPLVRPPRLGGNQRKGVFATRSTFRPNPIGLSVVELVRVEHQQGKGRIHVRGLDLLDGTPVLDIKPYLPYADAHSDAAGGFADERPDTGLGIVFSDNAELFLEKQNDYPQLREFITEVLSQDPRPAYQKDAHKDKDYGMHLYHFNIKWRVQENKNYVFSIE